MAKRTIALNLRSYDYGGLISFASVIYEGLQKMSLQFPSPVPSLPVFQSAIDEMKVALTKWGKKGNRGSHRSRLVLLEKRNVLRGHLKTQANYVMVTAPNNPELWIQVGFVLKRNYSKTGTLAAAQDLRQFMARNISRGHVKLKWKRPLGAPKTTPITYIVFRSADGGFANAIQVGTVVNKATYTDVPEKSGAIYYYWVMQVTAAGKGVLSNMCMAFASPV